MSNSESVRSTRSVAEFKGRHGSALPKAQVRNQAAAERASRDLMGIEAQMRAAEERQAFSSAIERNQSHARHYGG